MQRAPRPDRHPCQQLRSDRARLREGPRATGRQRDRYRLPPAGAGGEAACAPGRGLSRSDARRRAVGYAVGRPVQRRGARAQSTGVSLRSVKFENPPYDFEATFRSLGEDGAQALLVLSSPLFVPCREKIAALAIQYRLPAIYILKHYVEAGGLMSYGVDFNPMM